jgi:hypothetical protein
VIYSGGDQAEVVPVALHMADQVNTSPPPSSSPDMRWGKMLHFDFPDCLRSSSDHEAAEERSKQHSSNHEFQVFSCCCLILGGVRVPL